MKISFHMICMAILAITCLSAGCDTNKPVATIKVSLDTSTTLPVVDYAKLDSVLKQVATGRHMDAKKYRVNDLVDLLDPQLASMAICGPSTHPALFPGKESKLIYWLNARTAWTVKFEAMIDEARFENLDGPEPQPGTFPLNGRSMTLQEVDDQILAVGNFRHLIASPGLPPQRAPLPDEAFKLDSIDKQIRKSLNLFVDDPARFTIDIDAREVHIPRVMWRYRQQIVDDHRKKYGGSTGVSLLSVLLSETAGSPHRRLQDAVGYSCIVSPKSK